MESDLELYDVDTLPEFTMTAATMEADALRITWNNAAANGTLQKLAVYAVESKYDPSDPEAPVTLIGIIEDEDQLTGNDVTLTMPADLCSGDYYIKVNATLDETLVDTAVSQTVHFTNKFQPEKPADVTVTNAGDYRLRVTEGSGEELFNAYEVNVYEQVGGEWQKVDSCSGATFAKGQDLVVGGRYAVYADETEEDPTTPEFVGLEPGKTYRVGVRKLNYLYYSDTPEEDRIPNNAMGVVMSEKAFSEAIELTAPQKPAVTVSIPGAKDIPIQGVTAKDENGDPVELNIPTVTSHDATVTVTSTMPIRGSWYLDNTSLSAAMNSENGRYGTFGENTPVEGFEIPFENLETQEHTLVLIGENAQGDAFTETYHFAVDTLAPVLQITAPVSGAFTTNADTDPDKADKIRVAGRTDPGATVNVRVNDGAPQTETAGPDGAFDFPVDADAGLMKNTVRVSVSDESGNTTQRTFSVYNYRVNYLESLRLYNAAGEDVTGSQTDTSGKALTDTLTLKGVAQKRDDDGNPVDDPMEFVINDDTMLEWELVPVDGSSTLTVGETGGELSAERYSQGMVTVTLNMTERGTLPDTEEALQNAGASHLSAAASFGLNVTEDDPLYTVSVLCTDQERSHARQDTESAHAGDTVTVTVTRDGGFKATLSANVEGVTFTESASTGDDTQIFTFVMPAENVRVTVDLVPTEQHTITLEEGSDAHGSVTIDAVNSKAYFGETITVTAAPEPGYAVVSVTAVQTDGEALEVSGPGEDGTYSFVMPTSDVTVTVTYEKVTYSVTVTQPAHRTVSAEPEKATVGDPVQITATPDAGYAVKSVTVTKSDEEVVEVTASDDGAYTFTMPADNVTVEAVIEELAHRVTVTVSEDGHGTASAEPTEAVSGTIVTVTAKPDAGYHVASVTAAGSDGKAVDLDGSGNEYTFTMPVGDVAVKVSFALDNDRVHVTVTGGEAGDVTVEPENPAPGETVTVTVREREGFTSSVTVTKDGGEEVKVTDNGDGTYTFTMPDEKVTVKVVIEELPHRVTVTVPDGHGTASVEPTEAVSGTTVTVTAKPDAGYHVASITATGPDGKSINIDGSGNVYTFTMPVGDVTVKVSFALDNDRVHVTVAGGDAGDVTVEPENPAPGETVTVTVTVPEKETYGSSVTVTKPDGSKVEVTDNGDGTYTFTMPAERVTVTVTYRERQFKTETGTLAEAYDAYPQAFKELYKSPEAVEEALKTEISRSGVEDANAVVYDVKLLFSEDGGGSWIEATSDNFPEDGVRVTLPYPESVEDSYNDYEFTLLHLITDPMNTGKTLGAVETVTGFSLTPDGISFVADCLSPFALGWREKVSAPGIYGVTVPETEHGTLTVSPTAAPAGFPVTVTVVPDEGYDLGELTAIDWYGRQVELRDNGDGTWSFDMPVGGVTVKAAFRECPSLRFPDLDVKEWYHPYTDYVITHTLMNGYDTGLFSPKGTVTRAEMVTVLWNMAERKSSAYKPVYGDVRESSWYYEAVCWATQVGVVNGYEDGTFRPDRAITRQEMAVMLYRFEKNVLKGGFEAGWSYELLFPDKDEIQGWALEAMSWCAKNGLFEGDEKGLLKPGGKAERAALAKLLTVYRRQDGET